MQTLRPVTVPLLACLFASLFPAPMLAAKMHFVTLGPYRKVPYTPPEATPDNKSEEATTLKIRARSRVA